MRITRLEVLEARFPFRFPLGQVLASRGTSTSILVRATTDFGIVGFGEGLPRGFATSETPASTLELIAERLAPLVFDLRVDQFEAVPAAVDAALDQVTTSEPWGAARCAVELAVLDAAGRTFCGSVGELMGPLVRSEVTYSGALPLLPAPLTLLGAVAYRLYGIRTIKLKVGRSLKQDILNLRILRKVLGPARDVRVDANCAWEPDEAIRSIQAMEPYGIQAVEQPVAMENFSGLKQVADAVATAIMADESLRTLDDARRLAEGGMVDMFNIRLSKCGGLLAARRIAEIAAASGLTCQLGAQPGESAILSAAGRLFAMRTPNIRYFETSPGDLLLAHDLAVESISPRRRGWAPGLFGAGLGVEIEEQRLQRFVVNRRRIEAS